MPLSSDIFVLGGESSLTAAQAATADPFNDKIVDYLDRVSKRLLKDAAAKRYPDVVTFAFWCRKASVLKLRQPYEGLRGRLGRGLVFHIAPSNVPVNFAYSLAASLLAGNANVVRVPSKNFEQVDIIGKALGDELDVALRPFVCLVRYGHDQSVTDYLSALCDTRIIWGGDSTIEQIRRSPLKPRATEIAFSDRYSICVINADAYLENADSGKVAADFYNDTYLTDQNACTSPKLIVWMGQRVAEAQELFWSRLHELAGQKYKLQPIQAVSKHVNMCRQAIKNPGLKAARMPDNLVTRVKAGQLTRTLIDDNGNSGYFMEYTASGLEELLPVCTLECQTLAYYGVDPKELEALVINHRPKGIDRIVPIGKTMDFSLVWDGYDLIHSLTRQISVG